MSHGLADRKWPFVAMSFALRGSAFGVQPEFPPKGPHRAALLALGVKPALGLSFLARGILGGALAIHLSQIEAPLAK